jgi:hypothetical protein
MHETHEASRAIAALFHFTAISIEDAVAEIGFIALGFLNQQDLIAADPEMAVCQQAHLYRFKLDVLAETIQNHEIVASTVHFREF